MFDNFQTIKSQAVLEGEIFAQRTDDVEIIDADNGAVKFPWYTELEKYVVWLMHHSKIPVYQREKLDLKGNYCYGKDGIKFCLYRNENG